MPEKQKTKFRYKTFASFKRAMEAIEPHPGPEAQIKQCLLEDHIDECGSDLTPQEIWWALNEDLELGIIKEYNPEYTFTKEHLELFQDKHLYK